MKFCLLILFSLQAISHLYGRTYYVDAINGIDKNDGASIQMPWKTLKKVNSISYRPGDVILLKRGQQFYGSLMLRGSGRPSNTIRLGAYGTGKRPHILGGTNEYVIKILDEEHWEIHDIETSGGLMAGIFVGCTKDSLVLDHFRIINCYVHDVGDDKILDYGEMSTLTGGIVIANGNANHGKRNLFRKSIINDAIIDGCTVRYIKRWTCLSISSGVDPMKGNANLIRNCTTEYSVADGIRMNGVRNSFIEHSIMYKNGAWPKSPNQDWGGLGAWFFEADSCTIQYCEASYIDNWHNDGGAFDIDYYQTNSTIQYCYAHDCHGYGVSIFGADPLRPTTNSTIRFNVLSNNARDSAYAYQGDFYVFTWNGGLLDGVSIYNNTSYWNPASPAPAAQLDADFIGNNPNFFKNNIIYSDHPWLVSLKNDSIQLDNNLYWTTGGKRPLFTFKKQEYTSIADWKNSVKQDQHSIYADPLLMDPTYHGMERKASAFKLKKGSPAIDAGVKLDNMGERDFNGISIPLGSGIDIGACEYSGVTEIEQASILKEFEWKDLKGKNVRIEDYTGEVVVVSFIRIHISMKAEEEQETRAQLASLRSMQKQYAKEGLKILLVCETSNASEEILANFISDQELDEMVILQDSIGDNTSKVSNLTKFTITYIISKDGHIRGEWKSMTNSAHLAFAIMEQM